MSAFGAISTSRSGLEIAPRSPMPRDALAGRSHVYQRAKDAKGISLAPGIVPKKAHPGAHGARRHTVTKTPRAGSKADFRRLLARCHEAVSGKQSGLTGCSAPIHDAYAWAGSMGAAGQHMWSDARVSVANKAVRH